MKHFDFPSVDTKLKKLEVWHWENGDVLIQQGHTSIEMKIDDLMHILQMYPFPIKLPSDQLDELTAKEYEMIDSITTKDNSQIITIDLREIYLLYSSYKENSSYHVVVISSDRSFDITSTEYHRLLHLKRGVE